MCHKVLLEALELGIERKKIAQECGVSRMTVSNWEAGKHRIPQSALTVIEYLRRDREAVIEAQIEQEIAELRKVFNDLGARLSRIEGMKKTLRNS